MFLIICVSMVIASAVADVSILRGYSSLPAANFDEKKAAGKWYAIAKTPNPFSPTLKCLNADVHINNDGTITKRVSGLNLVTGFEDKWGGILFPKSKVPTGEYIFQFPPTAIGSLKNAQYTVLETDYKNYMVSLMIQDNGHPTKLTAYAWIESRTPKLALQFYQAAVAALQRAGIPVNALALVAQDC